MTPTKKIPKKITWKNRQKKEETQKKMMMPRKTIQKQTYSVEESDKRGATFGQDTDLFCDYDREKF